MFQASIGHAVEEVIDMLKVIAGFAIFVFTIDEHVIVEDTVEPRCTGSHVPSASGVIV